MIGRLQGELFSKSETRVGVDVQGVGYEVIIPTSLFYKLPEIGQKVIFQIYTHVREDNLQLFGFLSGSEKELFQLLMTVSGIGPKMALTIISEIPQQEFVQVILTSNIHRLSSISGIGKKTAERMVLELKSKMQKISIIPTAEDTSIESQTVHDLISALLNLGYKQTEIDRVVSEVRSKANKSFKFEELLKQSLHLLRSPGQAGG